MNIESENYGNDVPSHRSDSECTDLLDDTTLWPLPASLENWPHNGMHTAT